MICAYDEMDLEALFSKTILRFEKNFILQYISLIVISIFRQFPLRTNKHSIEIWVRKRLSPLLGFEPMTSMVPSWYATNWAIQAWIKVPYFVVLSVDALTKEHFLSTLKALELFQMLQIKLVSEPNVNYCLHNSSSFKGILFT